jgi:hypothetical protein
MPSFSRPPRFVCSASLFDEAHIRPKKTKFYQQQLKRDAETSRKVAAMLLERDALVAHPSPMLPRIVKDVNAQVRNGRFDAYWIRREPII